MTKLKKTRLGLYASLSITALVVVIAVGMAVNAFSGSNSGTVMENVNIETFNEAPEMVEGELGAMTSPDITSPYISVNGDRMIHLRGDLADGSLTLLNLDVSKYGFNASTTVVDTVRIRIDGVSTSSMTIVCGASTSTPVNVSYDLMTTGTIATSTGLGCVMENGLLTADNNASGCADGGSVQKISLSEAYPYFLCKSVQVGAGSTAGVTNANNTFDGDWMVRLSQTQ